MSRADRIAICASFVVTSSIGIVFLLRYWQWRGDEWLGATRAGVFVLVMALVHWLAARSYERQFSMQPARPKLPLVPPAPASQRRFLGVAFAYQRPVLAAIYQQLFLLAFSALILDMGLMFRAAMAAAVTQLAMIAVILLRRPLSPTPLDTAIIRYSPVPLFLLANMLQGFFLKLLDGNS